MIHAGHGTIRREHDQARSVFGVRQVAGVAEQPLRRPSARCGARRCTNRDSSRENARGPRDPGRDNPSKRPGPGAPRAAHPAGPAARKCPDCWQININAGWDGGRRDIAERVFAPSNRPVILPGRSETCCNGRPGDSLGGAAASRSMLILLAGCSVPVLQPGPHHRDVRVPHRSGGPRDRAISLYVNGASEPTSHPPTYRQLACVQLARTATRPAVSGASPSGLWNATASRNAQQESLLGGTARSSMPGIDHARLGVLRSGHGL